MRPRAVAVLASGHGSNLEALVHAQARAPYRVRLVIADRECRALAWARARGLDARLVPPGPHADATQLCAMRDAGVGAVALAGYLRRLSPAFLAGFAGPVLNIHPSLLPSFPGLHAHRQAIAHGVKVTGVTIHFVDEGLDSGPILLQEAVAVREGETPDELLERLHAVEHRLYPQALTIVVEGRYATSGRQVSILPPREE